MFPFPVPRLTLRESAGFSIPGAGGFQHKGKTDSCQVFTKRLVLYGKTEHKIPERPLSLLFITLVVEWPLPPGLD